MEDLFHSLHVPEMASRTQSAAGIVTRTATPLVPLSISGGGRTTSCCVKAAVRPWGAIITVVVIDEVPEHTTMKGGE